MLSDNAIDNLMQPIIERQEAINNFVINTIARRVKEIGTLLPSDVYKLERLLKSGDDVRRINKEIARLTGLNESAIKKLIKKVAQDAYVDVKPYYDYRHKSFIPFEENVPLQNIVKSIALQTADTYLNLSKSQALGFMIRDRKYPKRLKFHKLGEAYQSVIDEAVQAVQSGVLDYNQAMSKTLSQLVDSGVRRVTWESGYTQRLDTAVRRNILDGVRAINQGVQDETGKQFGADGKEITVHENSAPDHEPIQGHQFANKEYDKLQSQKSFKDVEGIKFQPIARAIGTLNCRHFTYSIIIGHSKPRYSLEELEKMKERNEKGYTTPEGKHMTLYECTQKQREMETLIRSCKDGQIAAREAGNEELAKKYQARINKYTNKYKAFSNACGLSVKLNKARVKGYHRISVN